MDSPGLVTLGHKADRKVSSKVFSSWSPSQGKLCRAASIVVDSDVEGSTDEEGMNASGYETSQLVFLN